MNERIGHICPEDVIIDVVINTVPEYRGIHPGADKALGNMAVYRVCLDQVRERYTCDGPKLSQGGQWVCPLGDMAKAAKALTTSPYPAQNYQLELDRVPRPAGGPDEKLANGVPVPKPNAVPQDEHPTGLYM